MTSRWSSALLLLGSFACDGGGGDDDGSAGGSGTGGSSATGGSGGTGAAGGNCDDDRVVVDGRIFTEAPSGDPLVCDAQIQAIYYADFADGAPGYNLLLHFDYDEAARTFRNFLSINVYGDLPGDYSLGGGSAPRAEVAWVNDGAICTASAGTLTLAALGSVGGLATGSLSVDAFTGSGCPFMTDVTFSMTIVDGGLLGD